MFDDHEDVEYFCTDVIGESKVIKSIRFIIENSENIIVIFDSEMEPTEVDRELYTILIDEHIKFYFLFKREDMVTAHLPQQIKDLIFTPTIDNTIIRVDYEKNKKRETLDLDRLLEKIEESGIESLTTEEKNFLDNFEN
jgi:GTP-binding protein EngB required for normal cell division